MYGSLSISQPLRGRSGILSTAATGLSSFIAREGGDARQVFGIAGAGCLELDEPMSCVDLHVYCQALEQAALETGTGNFGLRYGRDFKPADLGSLGYLALASPTVGDALANMSRLFHHHQQRSVLRVVSNAQIARVEYQIVDPDIRARRQDAELSLGMFFNVLRHALGDNWRPDAVQFEHGEPVSRGEHEDRFGAPVRFAQTTNAIVFRRDVLDERMPEGDARLLGLMRHNLQHLGLMPMQPESLTERVKAVIRERLNGKEPSLDDISSVLGIANWTLQRRLRAAGLTYQQVLLDVRKSLALDYLRDTSVQISELSFLLGYSEISAFSRAFHRWHGISPSDWRRANIESGTRL